jgi:TonB family protein
MPDPSYTREAMQKGITGQVSLTLEILPDGTTNHIRVVKSLDPGLDQSAVETVARWRFQPATKSGIPVSAETKVVMTFQLPGMRNVLPGPGIYSDLPCAAKIDSRDIKGLLKKAHKGDPEAQFVIGCAYEYGVALQVPDRAQAIDWYRKAAESLVPAQYFLGETYLLNFDYVNAYTWLKLASLGGYDDPHDRLKTVTLLLSKKELSEAEEQVAAWKQQHGTN